MAESLEQKYVAWRTRYLRSYNAGFYVFYNDNGDNGDAVTCSEAHGYGLLISVLKRNQADFDGLLNYFETFCNRKGLMQWQQQKNKHGHFVPGDEGGENSATDGDIDIATALFLAARVWGHGGPQRNIDYRAKAVALCRSIWEHTINHTTFLPKLGDWVDEGNKAHNLTRPADFILSHFLVFYYEDHERKDIWGRVIESCINELNCQLRLHPTGLIADFLESHNGVFKAPTGKVLEDQHDGCFNWNSCRVPWRIAHYYHQTQDARVRPLLEAQARFFAEQMHRHDGIKAGYKLDGRALESYTDLAFIAPASFLFWVLGWTNEITKAQQDMNDLDDNTYFGETIALICLLQASVPY
ncbi:Six-hairpin glycosidase-like protein [Jimgerdemannia flammicorona]|uniref:Six-hairpin glycosidase-like protein n=2 Tax=Jimgerdemannia flammicorona TaxID=994334 RepID=A0A433Q1N9_9FUNG|nr:Six-hairpin glycosidase-like protein [Jimgerdemannia flammicorona]RUS23652.1 Six-hairpin glycosidase-like protein [Jimgerdemannia flammicorona]